MAVVEKLERTAPHKTPFHELEATLLAHLSRGDMGPVHVIETALAQAVHHAASDLYIEPRKTATMLRVRIDGALHDVAKLSKAWHERLVARVKVLAKLPVYQHGRPVDGRIDPDPRWHGRSIRVAILPTVDGEMIVLRVIDAERTPLELNGLGLRPEVTTGLLELIARPQGTLLLTGPSSSGKTTTIYALLAQVLGRDERKHVVTVEDPVEYRLDGICQTQVDPENDYSYEQAVRAVLRQDPDAIVIGEIRDRPTAQAAIQAGLTGHLVLSTIHSGTAAGVFTRLLDMDIEPYLVASSVNGVLAQRLVRLTCPACSEPYAPSSHLTHRFGLHRQAVAFHRGTGCRECRGLGYQGRSAIAELLNIDETIADHVLKRGRTRVLHAAAVEAGMTTLLHHGLEKVRRGLTTLEELQRVVSPEET